ncbi:MAG: tyrosine-type recombinase/integrase [Actinoallomurus sp.]
MPERAACGGAKRRRLDKLTRWVDVVRTMGVPGLHFHDLRHTGNTLAADMGVSLRNLMARMGHDNERAALIYQHASNKADRKVAEGLDALLKEARGAEDAGDDPNDGATGAGDLIAR